MKSEWTHGKLGWPKKRNLKQIIKIKLSNQYVCMYVLLERFDKESQEIMTCGFLQENWISEECKKKWLYSRTSTLE